jgi:hypothetical protein
VRSALTRAYGNRSQAALHKHELINAAFDAEADVALYSDRPVVYDETARWRQVGTKGPCVLGALGVSDGLNVTWAPHSSQQVVGLGGWSRERGAELVNSNGEPYQLDERLNEKEVYNPLQIRGPFGMFDYVRSMVSQEKLRYKMDGFDLDLRYITPSMIAMGYPADRSFVERLSRNHIDEIVRIIHEKYKGKVSHAHANTIFLCMHLILECRD